MNNRKINFLIIIVVALFTSCSKGDSVKTKKELLSIGGWLLQAKQTKLGNADWNDVTSGISSCKKDDLHSFASNGQYTISEGGTKCNTADPNTVATGTWELLNNEADIKIIIPSSTLTYTIDLVTENALTITHTDATGIVVVQTRYIYNH